MPTTARRSCSRVSLVGIGDRLQQGVERGVDARRGRGLSKASVADACLGQLDPGGDALGGEVALVALDRLQRLVLRPALEALAGQGDGDVGAARLQLGRLAQGELVACRQAARRRARAPARRTAPRLSPSARRRRTRRRRRRRGRPSPPGCPARRSAPPAPGWRRRRPWRARPGRRAPPPPPPAPGVSVRHGPHHSAQKSTTTGTCARALDHLALEGRLADVDRHPGRLVKAPCALRMSRE